MQVIKQQFKPNYFKPMRDFNGRITRGKQAEAFFAYWLKFTNIEYAQSGYEAYKASNQFMAKLKVRNDVEALNIRFTPDFLTVSDKITYFEIKHAANKNLVNIERKSYDRMIRLHLEGKEVRLVAYWDNQLYMLNDITDAVFHTTYFDQTKKSIVDGHWIAPRASNFNYDDYQQKTNGSGTTFGRLSMKENYFIHLNTLQLSLWPDNKI